jgi:hypothetical protein
VSSRTDFSGCGHVIFRKKVQKKVKFRSRIFGHLEKKNSKRIFSETAQIISFDAREGFLKIVGIELTALTFSGIKTDDVKSFRKNSYRLFFFK